MSNKSMKFTLGATGDILLHERLYNEAKKTNEAGYDFSELLKHARSLFLEADLNIVNQESIIAGEELGLSSYPRFNSPIEIGYLLKEFGVDIVNLANNHVLDRKEEGLLKSIENWKEIGIPYVGAYSSQEDKETVRIFHKNGLRIAFLSYTKRMAGVRIPKNKKYLVDSFENTNVKHIEKRIKSVRSNDLADIIVVSVHYGKEYFMLPTKDQIEITNNLAESGADVILGHHPHVLQPPKYITNSRGKKSFVIYSLGNFYSGQLGIYRQIGGYLTLDIEKSLTKQAEEINVFNPKMKLTYVDSTDKKDYKIYLLKDIVEKQDFIKADIGIFKSQEIYERMKGHMRKWITDLDVT